MFYRLVNGYGITFEMIRYVINIERNIFTIIFLLCFFLHLPRFVKVKPSRPKQKNRLIRRAVCKMLSSPSRLNNLHLEMDRTTMTTFSTPKINNFLMLSFCLWRRKGIVFANIFIPFISLYCRLFEKNPIEIQIIRAYYALSNLTV